MRLPFLVSSVVVAAACAAAGTPPQATGADSREPAPAPLGAAQAGAAPAAPAPKAPTRLVLVTIDTLRADRLSCYGWFRETSPFIDSLAEQSLVFDRCYAPVPHTTPSHASLLTSVLPLEHGITHNSWTTPKDVQRSRALVTTPQMRSYAEILKAHGFATGGFVTAATTCRLTGLAAGFDAWSEPHEDAERRPGEAALADARAWLATVRERPFFLWVHFFDVHGPYERDAPYADQFGADRAYRQELAKRGVPKTVRGRRNEQERPVAGLNAAYDAAIRHTDDLVAQLVAGLRELGLWDDAVFVLTADHGEGLGEHDFIGHALAWGEHLRVPLIVRIPGREPDRLDPVISSIDVLPTLLDLVPELPRDALLKHATGVSAIDPSRERPVFAIAAGESEHALITRRWKLVRRKEGGDALYDLMNDPLELRDVKAEHPDEAAAMAEQLALSLKTQEQRNVWLRQGGEEPKLTPEEEERRRAVLKALGYAE